MALPANATIVYVVGSGAFSVDAETGNPIETTQTRAVKASIKQKKADRENLPGLDPSAVYIEGYILDRDAPPLPNTCQITITDVATNQTLTGTFSIDTTIQSRFKAVTKALGTRIQGYFLESGK